MTSGSAPSTACSGALTGRPVLAVGWELACAATGLLPLPPEADPKTLVAAARRHGPLAVTFADHLSVSSNALDALRGAGSKVVLLVSGAADPRSRAGMRALPDAVICVEDPLDVLDVALGHVLRGETYISPFASRSVLADLHRRRDPGSDRASVALSDREQAVLRLMVEGLATKAIARRLGVAVKTVEAHRSRVFTKLQVRNQKQAVVLALSEPQLLDSRR